MSTLVRNTDNAFKLLDALFDGFLSFSSKSDHFLSYPPTNIYVNGERNGVIIEMAVAGFSESDLKVYYDEGRLVIEGKKPKDDDPKEYIVRNLSRRDFIVKLPVPVSKYDPDKGEVNLKDGILTISIPFREKKGTEKKLFPISS